MTVDGAHVMQAAAAGFVLFYIFPRARVASRRREAADTRATAIIHLQALHDGRLGVMRHFFRMHVCALGILPSHDEF